MYGAGATLVAIVGGLLVTRYITFESELQPARERLLSSEARLAEANKGLAEVEDELRTSEIEAHENMTT
jgi:type II secretory pathway component PulM